MGSIWIACSSLKTARGLNRAKFLYDLHKDFFTAETYKFVLDALDEPTGHETIGILVKVEDSRLLALLNAFELVAYFVKTRQLTVDDVDALLEYYFECVLRHHELGKYIKKNSFQHLDALLGRRL